MLAHAGSSPDILLTNVVIDGNEYIFWSMNHNGNSSNAIISMNRMLVRSLTIHFGRMSS